MLHDLSLNGLKVATTKHFKLNTEPDSKLKQKFLNRLSGYINFIGQVRGREDEIFGRMKNEYLKVVSNAETPT